MTGERPLAELVQRLRGEGRLAADGSVGHVTSIALTGIADDSRAVEPGNLFVAVRGLNVDGHDFVGHAVSRGTPAVLVERPIDGVEVPQLVVDRGAASLASAAAWWFGDPSRELLTVGVTGTNGKTTTTFLAAAGLKGAGFRTGIVGTIGVRVAGDLRRNEVPNTTPPALELQRILREMVDAGEQAVVIETSSHGLAAERVGSVAYDAGIFTNLSQEHLDFHGTFEAYRDAKLSLFQRLPRDAKGGRRGVGVANVDDPLGRTFLGAAWTAGALGVGYGDKPNADVRVIRSWGSVDRPTLEIDVSGKRVMVGLKLVGRFNAHNVLAVFGLASAWDLDLERVASALANVDGVPGRMERIDAGHPFTVIVDYAHTPGALEAILTELEPIAGPDHAVISVFGASGERDVGKRPLMGEAAARHSRLVIVTEDDSRGEDPQEIFEQIAAGAEQAGARRGESLLVIPDRREAIAEAFRRAQPGDVVLLAGKGHETWNMGPNGPEPWSDRETAEELLRDQVRRSTAGRLRA